MPIREWNSKDEIIVRTPNSKKCSRNREEPKSSEMSRHHSSRINNGCTEIYPRYCQIKKGKSQ